MNTHSETITDKDSKPIAFVDGIPDKCDHVWDGDGYVFNDDGEYFKNSEVPDIKLNDGKDLHEFYILHSIRGGCVSCSKCGTPYEPDFWA